MNETGDTVTSPFKVFEGWCSVFDTVPFEASQGWTAVGQNDPAFSQADQYLAALGVPQDGGYYIVSPAFWSTQGTVPGGVNPMLPRAGYSDCLKDVPVRAVMDESGLTPGYDTLSNPKCFGNGPAGQGFEAGGYDASGAGWHWYSKEANSPVGLTKDYAASMGRDALSRGGQTSTTRAKILYSYIYGVAATNVDCIGLAQGPNGKDRFRAGFFNSTPYLVKDATLRAYIVQNGKYTLAASTKTQIGPVPVGDGRGGTMRPAGTPSYGPGVKPGATPNSVEWEFEVSPPSGQYELRVTINMQYSENGLPLFEPLNTVAAYGRFGALVPPLTGQKMEKAPSLLFRGSNPYDDNWANTSMSGVTLPPPGGEQPGTDDLAVTSIQVLDAETGQPVSSPRANQPLKVRATFASGFNVGGWAKIRLYKYQVEFKRLDEVGSTNIYLEPHGSYTKEWSGLVIGEGQYKFIASICYYNTGNDPSTGWRPEKFDGKYDEKTYDNNKKEADLTGTEQPPHMPQPREWSQPAWYPPLAWRETPVYETVTEPVYGWKKVPFTKEQPEGKVRVRLVE